MVFHKEKANSPETLHVDVEEKEGQSMEVMMSPNENLPLSPLLELEIQKEEETVASAIASEKARMRHLGLVLDKWVAANNNNLYPSRNQKNIIAEHLKMTYAQVNRWFANRRRKQTKRSKVVNSPACLTPAIPAVVTQDLTLANCRTPENEQSLEAFSSQSGCLAQEKAEMVVQPRKESPLTPPAEEAHHYNPQEVPDMSQLAANPSIMKLIATYPQIQYQLALQLHFIQQQQQQILLQQQMAALAQQVHTPPQPAVVQHQWVNGSSVSASPAHISDSEISDLSELTPPPSSSLARPDSPLFKDPHKLADPSMMALMSLSEREQLAVNILVEMATEIR